MKGGECNKKKVKNGIDFELPCSRRNFIKRMAVAVSSSMVGAGLIKPRSIMAVIPPLPEINIGVFAPSHCTVPFVYTKLKGFFQEEKLRVNLINYPDMALIANDLISGKLDFGQLIVPLVFAIHTGSKPFTSKTPMVITQITGTNGAALMVRKGAGIINPLDFKGKTIVNHAKLSVHYLINMMFLEKHGLDYQKSLNFRVIKLNKIVEALQKSEVDAFIMPEPRDAMIEKLNLGEVYMLSKYIWPNHPCCGLVTRKAFFDKNSELVISVTRAMTKGGLLANEAASREGMIDLLQGAPRYKYNQLPRDVLRNAFTPGRSDFYPFPYQSAALVIIDLMKKYGLLSDHIDSGKLAGEVFLSHQSRRIMRELGANPPESDYREERILGNIRLYS
ncbi:MAG: ABC transporter substrate-binding protein [bacterium]